MILLLPHTIPVNLPVDGAAVARMVGQTIPVRFADAAPLGKIVYIDLYPESREISFTVELDDSDPAVQSFQRMVGTRVQRLSQAGAPDTHAQLDALMARAIREERAKLAPDEAAMRYPNTRPVGSGARHLVFLPSARKRFSVSPLWTEDDGSVVMDPQGHPYRGLNISAQAPNGAWATVQVFLDTEETAQLQEQLAMPMTVLEWPKDTPAG